MSSTKRGRKEKDAAGEKKAKAGKSDQSQRSAKKKQKHEGGAEDEAEPVRLLELPAIMPPPPCLFVEAIVPPGESGSQYVFQGWSLNQLDGLASDFEHIGRVVSDLEPLIQAELDHIEAFESDSAGLPAPAVIEGGPGGGQMMPPPPSPAAAAATAAAAASSGSGGAADVKRNEPDERRAIEESYADQEEDFEYGDEDEDEYDYRASTTSGPKKAPSRNSFWGWMEQYFVPLGPQHLALLRETKVASDPSFTIPKLGQLYSERWGSSNDRNSNADDLPRVGDVTARLLAALVSDVPANKKAKRRPDSEALRTSKTEKPPQMEFSPELAAQIDDKLRGTLMQTQLMGAAGLPPPDAREDDEICETIRSLQHQLKQQIKANNALKDEYRPLVEKRMREQGQEEESKKGWDEALKRYEELMTSKKKSKKRDRDDK